MSAIAGIVHLDGRPVGRPDLQKIADGLLHRAPEGLAIWSEGRAGLIHGRLTTTPESVREPQPFVAAPARLAITFDGRLDNRDELIRALDVTALDTRTVGDAELTLHAYRAFNEACAERLLGDFAFAIWDGMRRRLFCARDTMGVKPFCYRVGHDTIAWASEVGVLATQAGSMPQPNEGMVAEYLTGVITDKQETLYRDVYRLPPAHLLTADSHGLVVRRYWQPDLGREIRYRHDDQYVEHLCELVRVAVAARLRTSGLVGIMLSGGVDSSSVTGLAHELLCAGAVPCNGIETFSLAVPGPDDESPFFNQVVERWKLPAHRVVAGAPAPGQFRDEAARFFDIPTYPNSAIGDSLRARVRDRGARVLLTGIGSDEWLGPTPGVYADLLTRGRLRTLARRARREAALDDFIGWPGVAKAAMWPLMPAPVKRFVRRALGRGQPPAWLNPEFAARTNLSDRLARHGVDGSFQTHEQYDLWHDGTSGGQIHDLEMLEREGARFGFEYWHPFLDRRVAEFGLALPSDQRWRDERAKGLLRRAMAPYLPPEVTNRLTSPGGSHELVKAIDLEGGSAALDGMVIEGLGWIRGRQVRILFERMTRLYRADDDGYMPLVGTLWLVLAVELWARAIFGSPQPAGARLVRNGETVLQ